MHTGSVVTNTITSHTIHSTGGIAFPASISDGSTIPLAGQGPWRINLQWTNGGGGRLYYQIDDNSAVKGYLTKTAVSDRRLKSNITEEIDYWLSQFDKIKIYEFEYNEKLPQAGGGQYFPDGEKRLGVIADEVEKIFPQYVLGQSNDEEYQSVDYSSFIPVLMAVVKKQYKTIEELSSKVDELESRMV